MRERAGRPLCLVVRVRHALFAQRDFTAPWALSGGSMRSRLAIRRSRHAFSSREQQPPYRIADPALDRVADLAPRPALGRAVGALSSVEKWAVHGSAVRALSVLLVGALSLLAARPV